MDSIKDSQTYSEYIDAINIRNSNFSIIVIVIIIAISIIVLVAVYKLLTINTDEIIVKQVYNRINEERDFLMLSKSRYSVRDYSDKSISNEFLEAILQAGRIAPTAMNMQPQKVFVLKSRGATEKINKCCNLYNAPLAILVCTNYEIAWKNDRAIDKNSNSAIIDASIVATQMMYEATSLGLGSTWIAAFDEDKIIKEFNLDENTRPICVLAIGYPKKQLGNSDRFITERKPLNETTKII